MPFVAGNDTMTDLPLILCVDDDEVILSGFRQYLKKQFTVATATTGEEALRYLSGAP